MGLSWSSRRRNNHHGLQNPSVSQPSSSSSSAPSQHPIRPPPPPPTPPSSSSSNPPTYAFAANAPYPSPPHPHPPQNPYPTLPPPSPPPNLSASSSSSQYHNPYSYAGPMMSRPNYPPFYANQNTGWPGFRPPAATVVPPPYVDHQSAKKVKNDVNVHKDTIRVELDEKSPDCHLVSFTFDALVDGSITIFYFAKEGANCTFTPFYPEMYMPLRIPFQKGLGQKFCQPSGTGIDLGFFDMDQLSKPSPREDIFPFVISAETCLPSLPMDEQLDQPLPTTYSHAQITQAVLEKNNEGHFQVRVIKQILWIDGVRYELREIYGIGTSDEAGFDDTDPGKECVICMTEPKDTAVLPCRHMCMCSECAKTLRLQTNKCPICRQPIQELIEIKVQKAPALS